MSGSAGSGPSRKLSRVFFAGNFELLHRNFFLVELRIHISAFSEKFVAFHHSIRHAK